MKKSASHEISSPKLRYFSLCGGIWREFEWGKVTDRKMLVQKLESMLWEAVQQAQQTPVFSFMDE